MYEGRNRLAQTCGSDASAKNPIAQIAEIAPLGMVSLP